MHEEVFEDLSPGEGVLPLWPNRGSGRFEGLIIKWLPNGPICQPHTTNWGYSKIPGHLLGFNPHAPLHANLVTTAIIINEF